MNEASCKELLQENRAKLLSRSDLTGTTFATMRRTWPAIRYDAFDDCLTFLKTYTSADNHATASGFVNDPKVDGKVQDGVWYGALVEVGYNETDPAIPGRQPALCLIQTLVKGSLELSYYTAEDNCRFLVQRYQFFDLTTWPTLPSHSTGVQYKMSPANFDKTTGRYSGYIERWTRQYQTTTFTQEIDGAGSTQRIIQDGVTTQTITSMASEAGKAKRQTIELLEDCAKNVTTDTETPIDQETTNQVNTAAEAVVDTEHTFGDVISDFTAAAGTTKQVQQTATKFSGKYRTLVRVTTPTDQSTISQVNTASETVVDTEHTFGDEVTDFTAAAGTTKQVTQSPTPFSGKFRTLERVTTPTDQETTSKRTTAADTVEETAHTFGSEITDFSATAGTTRQVDQSPTPFSGKFRTLDRVTTPTDQSTTSQVTTAAETIVDTEHTFGTVISDFTAAAGTTKQVTQSATPFSGKYRTLTRVTTPTDQSTTSQVSSAAETVVDTEHTFGSVITDFTAAAGTTKQVTQSATPFSGKYRTLTRVTTPTDQSTTSKRTTAAETVEETAHTFGSEITDFSATAGTTRQVDQAPTPFSGKFRTLDRITTPTDQSTTSQIGSAAETVLDTEHTFGDEITDFTVSAGTTRQVSQVATPFSGKFRTLDRVTTPTDQSTTSKRSTAAETVEETAHTFGSEITDFSASTGTTRQVDQAPTPFSGKFRTLDRVTTPTDQSTTSQVTTAAETVVDTEHTFGEVVTDFTAASGTTKQVTQSATPFSGKYRTLTRVTTPTDQETTSQVTTASETVVDTEHTFGEVVTDFTAASGTTKQVTQAATPFSGKYRTLTRVTTPTDQLTTSQQDSGLETVLDTEHTFGSEITDMTAAAGTARQVTNTATPFSGKFRTLDRVITPKALTTEEFTSYDSSDESRTFTAVENSDSIPTASSTGPTVTDVVSGRKNRYGKYDYQREISTAKDSFGSTLSWTVKGDRTVWRPASGGTMIVQYYHHHTKGLVTTATAAAAAITGGDSGSDWGPYKGGYFWWEKVVTNLIP